MFPGPLTFLLFKDRPAPLKKIAASNFFDEQRGFSKTSVFGKATLILIEKAGFGPLFRKPIPKLTGFWDWLQP
jgi:hypothetical protein